MKRSDLIRLAPFGLLTACAGGTSSLLTPQSRGIVAPTSHGITPQNLAQP